MEDLLIFIHEAVCNYKWGYMRGVGGGGVGSEETGLPAQKNISITLNT